MARLAWDGGGASRAPGQQYAEVCYVTDWTGYSKNSPDYRFAIREPLRNPQIDMEELAVPTMQMGDGTWYREW